MLLKKSGEAHIEKVDGCSDCGSSEVEGNMEKSKIEKKTPGEAFRDHLSHFSTLTTKKISS